MMEIQAMTDGEVLAELEQLNSEFTPRDFERLEQQLHLRAYCLGWTGDPLKQPPRAVLASARAVKGESDWQDQHQLWRQSKSRVPTLRRALHDTYWFCLDCEGPTEREESDQGQPARCGRCGSHRLRLQAAILH